MRQQKPQNEEEAREGVEKSYSDLIAARVLKEHGTVVRGAACFHCQQSAEKMLKAFLVYKHTDFERVHNIEYLLDLCTEVNNSFEELRNDAELMAPFAVHIRYPGYMEVTESQALNALSSAEHIFSFIIGKLPQSLHPAERRRNK